MKKIVLAGLVVMAASSLQGCISLPVLALAGVGTTGVIMAQDRRTSGVFIEDEAIENKAISSIGKGIPNGAAHINVTSFNRNVLVSGEALTNADRAEVARLVGNVTNVRNVYNEVLVAPLSSTSSRSNDTMITGDVKMGFTQTQNFSADHVKVVTEAGTVFLMGLVDHNEASIATDIASRTNNVQRVVKLFEYID
ncbi:MAG: BON domain-containing protein [Gallionella sp.]|nr:BON domain-containing protein [Gallionella sp.]MDD4958238.1 BON domain-containing protein [Gallionella sp.]